MQINTHTHIHDAQNLLAHVAFDETISDKRPGVLILHDWTGRNQFACSLAEKLAGQGYVGFAADLYGDARLGSSTEEKQALMTPLLSNRPYLLERINLAFQELCSLSQVDETRVAAIGFCFGGLCVLDLARSGASVAGVVSFHGILSPPMEGVAPGPISSKVLVLHGYDDPMVQPEMVVNFCSEMTEANADWQVQMYGHTKHAFTNPQANDLAMGTVFAEKANRRAFAAMDYFFGELFA